MYKFAFVLLLFCCFPLYPPLFNQLFLPPKSHCIFIFEFHTFTICFHRGIICNITLSSVISSIIYSLSSVVSSNTCILSSVKSSNTFIQSSVISSQYLYPIICDIIPIPIIYIQSLWYHPIPKLDQYHPCTGCGNLWWGRFLAICHQYVPEKVITPPMCTGKLGHHVYSKS